MSDESFADYIARERERLSREREEISSQRRELDNRLAAIDREFQALEAYQTAKTGKLRGARRTQTQRLSRGEILERMGLKGDRSAETSISNALNALLKRNQIRREGGKYYPGSLETGEPELPLGANEGDPPPEASAETSQD